MLNSHIKQKKILSFGVVVIFICAILIIFLNQILFIRMGKCHNTRNIGIIDGYLSENLYDNVTYQGEYCKANKTHGDLLLNYAAIRGYHGEIYYYSAADANGKITTDLIISGLNWMQKNGISEINISLSTKKYDSILEEWIQNHPDIQIYCSYNNKENTYDYPAMYNGVIASGISNKITYKNIDKKYDSNKIVIWNRGFHYFYGNSFLSLETLLNKR